VFLIVGLGNPGQEYARTRHNVGFEVADELAGRHGMAFRRGRGRAPSQMASGSVRGQSVALMKPLTYMNESGVAVRAAADFYKVAPSQLVVVYDDMDLPLGRIRIREAGSHGGHNGIRSIIAHMRTDAVPRIRIGIGRPAGEGRGATGHVLGGFRAEERPIVAAAIQDAADAVEQILTEGPIAAMNRFNAT
jgi:peptidyl-tRNA hydrolase, PTH1 family